MNLLDSILNAQDGKAVRQLSQQFGLREDQAASAIQNLAPAIAGGLQRNITQGGLDDLLVALNKGQHQRYLDDPSALTSEGIEDGNKILGHVLGSKQASRQVAAEAAQRTGIGDSVLKKVLPAVAALTMGALSRNAGRDQGSTIGGRGNDIMGMLTPLLNLNPGGIVSGFFKKTG